MEVAEEPQTIFDLTPDELDTLILYRKLSPEGKTKLENYINEQIKKYYAGKVINMFYYRFLELCKQKGVPPSRVALENNLNKSTVTVWKKQAESGKEVSPQADTLNSLSEYFGVSVDYLLGKTDIQSPQPTSEDDELLLLLDELRNRPDICFLVNKLIVYSPKEIEHINKILTEIDLIINQG